MKLILNKSLCYALSILLILSMLIPSVSANDSQSMILVSETLEQISGETYLIISVYEEPTQTRASSFQKNGSKTYELIDSDGKKLWEYTVKGSFNVNQGVSAVCTSSVSSHEIYSDNWHFNGSACRASGNQAIGDAEFIRKLLGIQVETRTCHVVLTCDANGNLS